MRKSESMVMICEIITKNPLIPNIVNDKFIFMDVFQIN